ncbi:MAG: hypothetical protein ABR498_06600 [Candidatus Dormibacteria bacterium]
MRTITTVGLTALALVAAWAPQRAAAQSTVTAPSVQRLYLTQSSGNYSYWTPDTNDPELQAQTITRTCPRQTTAPNTDDGECLEAGSVSSSARRYLIGFMPGGTLEAPLSWDASAPLHFHVALSITYSQPSTVRFEVQSGTKQYISDAATQTAAGIWDGTLSAGGPVPVGKTMFLNVVIDTTTSSTGSSTLTATIGGAGQSYVDLATPTPIASTSSLLGPTNGPGSGVYSTAGRTLHFNDSSWSASAFTGDLTTTRTFQIALPSDAVSVIAWLEGYNQPFITTVLNGGTPNAMDVTDEPVISLTDSSGGVVNGWNQKQIAAGDPVPQKGRGEDTVAETAVPAGTLTLTVAPTPDSQGLPYNAYIVVIYGDRTLASMTWQFMWASSDANQSPGAEAAGATLCGAQSEPVPVASTVTSDEFTLAWSAPPTGVVAFTPTFDFPDEGAFDCGEAGDGPSVRFYPNGGVQNLGAAPSHWGDFISDPSTVSFTGTVTFMYEPTTPATDTPEAPFVGGLLATGLLAGAVVARVRGNARRPRAQRR